ncbi:MAG: Replicative DNA helicase [Chlamydiae bacterium]|nr:Replicative DNA helicase [Chlamydiota bacterium]
MSTTEKIEIKLAPHSKESEMLVLGCMLSYENALNVCADGLDDTDFYFTEHQTIFYVLKDLYKQDKPADIHLVAEELKRKKKLGTIGGVAYLIALAQYAGTSANIEEYIDIVKGKALLRRMINAAQIVEKKALADPKDVQEVLDEAQQRFFEINQKANPNAGLLVKDLLSGVRSKTHLPFLKELEGRQEEFQKKGPNESKITGLPSGFIDLDRIVNGLGASNLIILAARPAMGKTGFAINMAEKICFDLKKPVGIFSLEMSSEQIMQRMISSRSEVESEKILTGSLNGEEYQRVVDECNKMQGGTMVIDDQGGIRITDLRSRARRMKEIYDIQVLFIDYLQLISGSGHTRAIENRQMEVSEISRMLKALAKELDIPVVCLSQLSRRVEERTGHRPQMSDLRESGSIEQDADVVIFMLRPDYYDPNDRPGLTEIIVGKNRHGRTGNTEITFLPRFAQFANLAKDN